MGIFSWFSGLFDGNASTVDMHKSDISNSTVNLFEGGSGIDSTWDDNAINPANGLPMIGGIESVDVEGNPFGMDFSHDDSFSGIDDSFSSGSGFDNW